MNQSRLDFALNELTNTKEQASGYIFYQPREHTIFYANRLLREIKYWPDRVEICVNGAMKRLNIHSHEHPVHAVHKLLDINLPSVWLLSADLFRKTHDPDIPLIWCVQAEEEKLIQELPTTSQQKPSPSINDFPEWSTESDQSFLKKISAAIEKLQQFPQGKIILKRPYEMHIAGRNISTLFSAYAKHEQSSACNHYFKLDTLTESFGCSPENVFEIINNRLIFDVVAATRGVSDDPATDQKWLYALQHDPKEIREHTMAFERYLTRLDSMIAQGTRCIEKKNQVLQLHRVRHLYSRMSGELKSNLSWLDVLIGSIPALSSYPDELEAWIDDASKPHRYYGGLVGRVSAHAKEVSFFLNLRGALRKGTHLYTQGGIGLIKESVADKELLEVKNKLRTLMNFVNQWN